jgi:hypothetical protein
MSTELPNPRLRSQVTDPNAAITHHNLTSEDELTAQHMDLAVSRPFLGKTRQQMEELIEEFYSRTGISRAQHDNYIRKGAYLAQSSSAFDGSRADELEPEDIEALKDENPLTGKKWNQPFVLYALVGCCSLGASVQGWDEV